MDQPLSLGIPYFVTFGNHELYDAVDIPKRGKQWTYQEDFARLLNNEPTPEFYTERGDYLTNLAFSFRKGNALFVILDAYNVRPWKKTDKIPLIGYISNGQYEAGHSRDCARSAASSQRRVQSVIRRTFVFIDQHIEIDEAMDKIRNKHGSETITFAALVKK